MTPFILCIIYCYTQVNCQIQKSNWSILTAGMFGTRNPCRQGKAWFCAKMHGMRCVQVFRWPVPVMENVPFEILNNTLNCICFHLFVLFDNHSSLISWVRCDTITCKSPNLIQQQSPNCFDEVSPGGWRSRACPWWNQWSNPFEPRMISATQLFDLKFELFIQRKSDDRFNWWANYKSLDRYKTHMWVSIWHMTCSTT